MEPVKLELLDGVARITFNRPEAMNAIDVPTAEMLLQICQDLRSRQGLRVVVLSGAGKAFMAGGDLAAFRDSADQAVMASAIIRPLHGALTILSELPVPVIGSVQGAVAGAGFSLAIGCDVTIAALDARFCMAYLGIATSIDGGGSWHLVRQIGLQKAMDLVYTNASISAVEAVSLGLVARAVPRENLGEETEKLVAALASGPTFAYGRVRRLLRQAGRRALIEQLADEHDSFVACADTADFREGISAFFARRKPQFTGH
jgi:2-(1,2-epoxy-1,2-dihydrophenyl)acetyl-CoA isomerase